MDKTENGVVLYVRSQQVSTDGRLMRYLSFMHAHNLACRVFCWNRTATCADQSAEQANVDNFVMPAKTGGRYLNAFKLIRWNFAIFAYCVRNRQQIRTIQCADFDSVLPCFLFAKLFSRPLIFDSYDRYSDSRGMGNPLKYLVDRIETCILQKADVAILPSERRIEQYQLKSVGNLIIIENVPLFSRSNQSSVLEANSALKSALQQLAAKRTQFRAVVSYVGILEPKVRGLENLLSCAAVMPDLAFIIAGSGPLDSLMRESAVLHANIFFVGALDYVLAEQVMAQSDLHIGLYYLSNPNHKYAAPNKYYEHLYFGKPLLTSKGTPPGSLVEQYSTGFAIGDSKAELEQFLEALTTEKLNSAATKARDHWQNHYANYHNEVFAAAYGRVVKL